MVQTLLQTSFQDEVIYDDTTETILMFFNEPRKVLSTAVWNGGYREDLQGIYNHTSRNAECYMLAPTLSGHMRQIDKIIGLDNHVFSGMVTAADVKNVSIQTQTYETLSITAIVTGGIENNAARVGDPTSNYFPVDRTQYHCGTINIILLIDADMPEGILARALVTCTEAKTAALQELMYDSKFSSGLATGSGTDQTIIVANPQSSLLFENAGQHDKLGELIGITVTSAVKKALFLETEIDTKRMHDPVRRMLRFGIVEQELIDDFIEKFGITKERAQETLERTKRHGSFFIQTLCVVNLLDQYAWGLIFPNELDTGIKQIFPYLSLQSKIIESKTAVTVWKEALDKVFYEMLTYE